MTFTACSGRLRPLGYGLAKVTPNPLVLAIASAVLVKPALSFSALHVLYVSRTLLPRELRPPRVMLAGLVLCSISTAASAASPCTSSGPGSWPGCGN